MCEAFKNGECNNDNCSFAHSADEMRRIDPALAAEVHGHRHIAWLTVLAPLRVDSGEGCLLVLRTTETLG